jgi:hypothetical protein
MVLVLGGALPSVLPGGGRITSLDARIYSEIANVQVGLVLIFSI